jgi:hypothetical protein
VCHSNQSKIKDKFQTVLQCKITQQITEHEGKERDLLFVTEGLPWQRKLKKAEKLLSWQRKKRLREGLAFRSFERCSSCDLEILGGVLGVLGGWVGWLWRWVRGERWRWMVWLWMVCAEGRLRRGVLRASSFIAIFGCLCCSVER